MLSIVVERMHLGLEFDNNSQFCYNYYMLKTRKKRSDRRHLIYLIQNNQTGEQYIGLTALSYSGSVKRTLYRRMQKHAQRAFAENKQWALSENLRKYGPEVFTYGLIEVVRGKKQCHTRELELIKEFQPVLNTAK